MQEKFEYNNIELKGSNKIVHEFNFRPRFLNSPACDINSTMLGVKYHDAVDITRTIQISKAPQQHCGRHGRFESCTSAIAAQMK